MATNGSVASDASAPGVRRGGGDAHRSRRPVWRGGSSQSTPAPTKADGCDKKQRAPGEQPIALAAGWRQASPCSPRVSRGPRRRPSATEDGSRRRGRWRFEQPAAARSKASPKEVSLTDPQAAWVATAGRSTRASCCLRHVNYLTANRALAMTSIAAEGTCASNRTAEIAVTQTMVERVGRRFDPRAPEARRAILVYGAVRLLKWLVDRKIAPHVPVWDKSARNDGTFSRADFTPSTGSANAYVCPSANCSRIPVSSIRDIFYLIGRAGPTAQDATSKHGVRRVPAER